jgi:replicative superfamily II helicase
VRTVGQAAERQAVGQQLFRDLTHMPFKNVTPSSISSDTPEALFRDLRGRRIPGLLSHQADILRDYVERALESSDVAFQLPTGSGKTLVGLLLGEWRRRKFHETVVYLCPTRQLVYQVVEQSNTKYGIRALPFIGKKAEYEPSSCAEYTNSEVLAVTTYSSLFITGDTI